MTETETEAGAETRQNMTRRGNTRQDDFAAYTDAAARYRKNILGLRSINQATQTTEERTENTQTNSQRDGATCKRTIVYVAQRRFPFIKGKGLGAFIRKHDLAWHISFSPWPPCSRHHW